MATWRPSGSIASHGPVLLVHMCLIPWPLGGRRALSLPTDRCFWFPSRPRQFGAAVAARRS
eukprot:4592518-Prymnesium_polylepis.1